MHLLEAITEPGPVPAMPSRFDQYTAKMSIARTAQASLPLSLTARVLRRHQPGVAHHLRGAFEALEGAHLGDDRDRRDFRDAAQRLERLDELLHVWWC